jgi:hypothetical protein
MGVVVNVVTFEGRAPPLSAIADKITELSGLPLAITESGTDVRGDIYDLHGYLAFASVPKQRLEIFAYRDREVHELRRLSMAMFVQGIQRPAETQSVYLRGCIGQEPTLLAVTALALEALGGRPEHPIGDEERREYGTPIAPAQLEKRQRKAAMQMRQTAVVGILLLPVVVVPMWIFGLGVLMPWRIWQGYKMYRRLRRSH